MKGRYQAWRFVHPDFDRPENGVGLQISNRGGIDMADERAAVRQSLLLLLSTRPGERIMHPTYGSSLHRLMFAPNDQTTAGLAIHYVREAITRFEPRVELIRIDTVGMDETVSVGRLDIVLEYRIRATQHADELAFPFDLMGERP